MPVSRSDTQVEDEDTDGSGLTPGEEAMRPWWMRTLEQLTRPQVLATIAPALVTYVMSAIGLYFTEFTLVELDAGSPGILGAAFGVTLFTSCYALVPVAMGFAWSSDRELGFMAWLGLAGMLGIPVLVLAAETSWLSLLGFLVHLLMAPRGTRLWLSIEYGFAAFCLLTFRAFYQDVELFPWGLPVLVFQAGVLLLMAKVAREWWVDDP